MKEALPPVNYNIDVADIGVRRGPVIVEAASVEAQKHFEGAVRMVEVALDPSKARDYGMTVYQLPSGGEGDEPLWNAEDRLICGGLAFAASLVIGSLGLGHLKGRRNVPMVNEHFKRAGKILEEGGINSRDPANRGLRQNVAGRLLAEEQWMEYLWKHPFVSGELDGVGGVPDTDFCVDNSAGLNPYQLGLFYDALQLTAAMEGVEVDGARRPPIRNLRKTIRTMSKNTIKDNREYLEPGQIGELKGMAEELLGVLDSIYHSHKSERGGGIREPKQGKKEERGGKMNLGQFEQVESGTARRIFGIIRRGQRG